MSNQLGSCDSVDSSNIKPESQKPVGLKVLSVVNSLFNYVNENFGAHGEIMRVEIAGLSKNDTCTFDEVYDYDNLELIYSDLVCSLTEQYEKHAEKTAALEIYAFITDNKEIAHFDERIDLEAN